MRDGPNRESPSDLSVPLRILVVAKNSSTAYSGGRLYTWFLADSLATAGHEVSYLTNRRPVFVGDGEAGGKESVTFHDGNIALTRLPREPYDVVIAVPHLRSPRVFGDDWIYYQRTVQRARRDKALLVLLNFESPNWVEQELGALRSKKQYAYWRRYGARAGAILSISSEGNRHAQTYYSRFNSDLIYAFEYPPINSRACDQAPALPVERRIVAITRFSDTHKRGAGIAALIGEGLRGCTLQIICGAGGVPQSVLTVLSERCHRHGVVLEVSERISDEEKFRDLKRARLLVYPSLFEGYGLPPVEAQFCGARVLAFDLPVLREVNRWPEGIEFVPRGDFEAMRERCVAMLAEDHDRSRVSANVEQLARVEHFTRRIDMTLREIVERWRAVHGQETLREARIPS